jgi:hypothetical protein
MGLILEAIFKADFEDSSYGFGRGRLPQQALEEISTRFRTTSYKRMRIADRSVLKLICAPPQGGMQSQEPQPLPAGSL